MKYYLRGDYYFDIDMMNQLRIAGPQNHLLLGLSFPPKVPIEIISSEISGGQLHIQLLAEASELLLTLPLVTDIRTLRSYTEPITPTPSYDTLVVQGIEELLPEVVEQVEKDGNHFIVCKNRYTDSQGKTQEYGASVGVDQHTTVELVDHLIKIKGKSPITMWIETEGTVNVETPLTKPVFQASAPLPEKVFSPELINLYHMAGEQVEYLIRTRKTSGFEYGTIFPRDWIESADLGKNDLSQETLDYMYEQSMLFISELGEGWHEDVVGQYKMRVTDTLLHVDRKMIDIEPKYILGFRVLSTAFLMMEEVRQRLMLVARYIVQNAEERDLITFKQVANDPEQYHYIGNWRDSYHAFPRQKSPLAPYDVNCVLYPEALRIIRDHADYFQVDATHINDLVTKWGGQKNRYRLYHPGEMIGYSLALHGHKRMPLPIAHLDEAYDLFYGSPSMEEVVSFARKVVSDDFFYTPVGPVLVANDEEDFSTRQYHGKVIWPKQSAYSVAGLAKQYWRGVTEAWPQQVLDEIKTSALTTAEVSFDAFLELQAVPELYYYDVSTNRSRFYTDQSEYEGQMSIVQLWSSIGFRRLVHDYAALQGYKLTEEKG